MEKIVVEKTETGIVHDNLLHDDSIEQKGNKMLLSKKEEAKKDTSIDVSTILKKRKGEDVSSPSKVKKEIDCEVPTVSKKDSTLSECEKVQESISTSCRSSTKTKFPLEDDEVVCVSKESEVIRSPTKIASKSSGSHTKIKLPLEDDDMVVTTAEHTKSCLKTALNTDSSEVEKCSRPPWWYNFATDINDDIMSILKK